MSLERLFSLFNHKIWLLLFVFYTLFTFKNHSLKYFKWNDKENHTHVIKSDGSGYYAYLPQFFIYKTKHYEFHPDIDLKYPGNHFFQELNSKKGITFKNKYFVGTAICIAPFFITTHLYSKMAGKPTDGYAIQYEITVAIAGIVFWLIGILSLICLLLLFNIPIYVILISLIGLTFGTNLFNYTVYEPSISHVYSFGLISFFLLQLKKFADSRAPKYLIGLAMTLGLITLVRPNNILIILLMPFFFESFKAFHKSMKFILTKQLKWLLLSITLFSELLFIQFLNIKSQWGFWGFNGYTTEKFIYLLNPKIMDVLFSYKKGFFVYTPYMLLILPGLFILYKYNKYLFIGFILFLAVFVYVMSAWWCWYYGGSLGMRPMVDIYGVFILPIAMLFNKSKTYIQLLLLLFSGSMIYYNLTLNYQYNYAILHYTQMDETKFKQVFMKTDRRFEWILFTDEPQFTKQEYEVHAHYNADHLFQWSKSPQTSGTIKISGSAMHSLIFYPHQTDSLSDIAIAMKFRAKIDDVDNIPKVMLWGWKNNTSTSLSVNFFGGHIYHLNQFYDLNVQLVSDQRYTAFDSLEVIFENGKGNCYLENVTCTFFTRK